MFYQSLAHCPPLSRWIRVLALFTTLTFFIFTLAAQQVSAATITVINTADSGAGSLRQAVADANATTGADTINFKIPAIDPNCNLSGVCTITLTGGVITIQAAGGSLTIANQTGASRLLISGNNVNRVFEVGLNANLSLDGLTVMRGVGSGTGSNPLGVVSNFRGTLTITNSVFMQNTGGFVISSSAFGTSGTLNVINTSVSNNTGVGIFFTNLLTNGGTANIVNSTISNNAAPNSSGGGIYFLGAQLTITNSTISGNSSAQGGGIFATVTPGTSQTSSIILTNSTVTANTASGGGGGIHVFSAIIKLRNTIVAGNMSLAGTPDFNFQSASATSLGNNLIGNATNTGSPNGQWLTSDILNQNAWLAPLDDNSGATETHALLPNSPAINAGNNCVLTANGCGDNNPAVPTDQRGVSRVGTVDIGAFEFVPRVPFDFDGDGRSDQAIFRPSDRVWYLLRSSLGFTATQFGFSTDHIVPADYDGDGITDIAVFRDGIFWYWLNSSNGVFNTYLHGSGIPVPADYTGDGRSELAVYRSGVWETLNTLNNQYQQVQFGTAWDKPVPADYDGDGKTDFAVYRDGTWYYQRSSDNGFRAVQWGIATDKPVVGDYDGDLKADQAVFRNGVWYVLASTQGLFAVQFGLSSDIPVPADYDGDGKTDIAVYRDGTWYWRRSSDNGFRAVQWGTANDKPIPSAFVP